MSSDAISKSRVSSEFSNAIQNEIKRLSGTHCWVCQCMDPQIAYVVGKKDCQNRSNMNEQVALWESAGLITFSLKSVSKEIPLCRSCHGNFDEDHDRGLIIIPTDLDFLIEFELQDQQRRIAEVGSRRQVPSSTDYKNNGGLYRPIFLKEFHGPAFLHAAIDYPRVWHGPPVAMLRRAMIALGSRRIAILDEATVSRLSTLRDLYFREKNNQRFQQVTPRPSMKSGF
ncbi:hypothetical protein N7495_009033 [Penicillium taxi]|uniref:uncharacterized protein n=1 Tax=Penicillium taxi TaxID=168475 RepID=UPI00254546E6|nr:uncharacterized protein N7495_009033 [Penicillium taxi]KAJ5888992.1 hypothetical protein N7495_009033 [Penicillium taxi]